MIAIVVAVSVGFAIGLYLLVQALFATRKISIREIEQIVAAEGTSVAQALATGKAKRSRPSIFNGLGVYLVRVTTQSKFGKAIGLRTVEQLTADLHILNKTVENHVMSKLIAAVSGFALPIVGSVFLTFGGVQLPIISLTIVCVVLTVLGFFYPDWPLSDDLEQRRSDFRQAFSSYIDLVAIYHAGSYGIRDAMLQAAQAGDGWAFNQIQHALIEAGHRNEDESAAFKNLGQKLGIHEVTDFGKAVDQTASRGAVIQESLISRSNSMRKQIATDLESKAVSGNEKMALPLVIFVLAILMFIGYGALNSISFTSEQNSPNQSTNQEQ